MAYQKTVLKSGVTVLSSKMPLRDSVALGIFVKVGGRYETKENNGIAHFLEHLVFKGTKSYTCRQIKESIEGVGGSFNAMTGQEYTCYFVKIPYKFIKKAMSVLSEMVLLPNLDQKEIDKERFVILEEIKMYKDLPQAHVHDLLDEIIWPNHPLGFNLAGNDQTVRKINRPDLLNFRNAFYNSSSMVISASGRMNHKDTVLLVKDFFNNLCCSEKNKFTGFTNNQKQAAFNILEKDTEQGHLALGFHSLPYGHKDRFALALLHIILGANMSSRLFNEVREKRGLAYEIGTQVKKFHDCGAFVVHAGIDNNKTIQAIEVIMLELNKIKESLVTDDEFRRAKDYFTGQLSLGLEDTLDQMFWMGEQTVLLDKVYSLKEIISQINKIKKSDLQRIAKDAFKKELLNLSFIGKIKDKFNINQSILCLN